MARRAEHSRKDSRYALRFAAAAFILISGTLVLVLFVLPQRYVLRPGFRESGMTFPNPSTPFALSPVVPVAARIFPEPPRPPGPPAVILPGPAEVFWSEVVPLFESRRYDDALPVFDRYLVEHPEDVDVRRERAITLLTLGRLSEAVEELRRLLESRDTFEQRLVLARTLRELGRTDEAVAEYERLAAGRSDDIALMLEWAQAYAWVQRYAEAAEVLERALARDPTSIALRVELARVYYSSNRLEDARGLLASLDANALAAGGALTLREDILAALYVPPAVPPTLLDRALAAREGRDLEGARALFAEALRASPNDPAIWQAYADLLEYELGDFEGARAALLEVERLSPPGVDLQYRLAQLEIWTGRMDDATPRLQGILASLGAGATGAVSRADVHATLGDLRRWDGDRLGAAEIYALALASDPENALARAGMESLEDDVDRQLVEIEAPRAGASAYSLADTDEFARVDLGGEWVDVDGRWVWGGTAGNRWVSGVALDGADALRQGAFVDLDAGRWWRLGTVRTGLDLGVQRLGADWEMSLGASVGHRSGGRAATELRYERGLAYPIAGTLQSLLARVVQDRFLLSHARPLGELWSVSALLDGAWLRADANAVTAGTDTGTGRLQGALTVARALSPTWTLGLATRSLVFTQPAPVTTPPGGGSRRLFWDPSLVVSVGPYAQLTRDLSRYWKMTGRLAPGIALIDERGSPGSDLVPHFSAEAGVRREGARFWTALDLFYYQGQFDGYRTYGARLTVNARDFSSLAPRP